MIRATTDELIYAVRHSACINDDSVLRETAARLELLDDVAIAARKESDPSKELRGALKKLDDAS